MSNCTYYPGAKPGKKHALDKQYALNSELRLLTRVYSTPTFTVRPSVQMKKFIIYCTALCKICHTVTMHWLVKYWLLEVPLKCAYGQLACICKSQRADETWFEYMCSPNVYLQYHGNLMGVDINYYYVIVISCPGVVALHIGLGRSPTPICKTTPQGGI